MRTSVLAVALVLSLSTVDAQQPTLTRYPLPPEITYPEGIAYDPKTNTVYTGSAETWALARLSPETRQATLLAPGGRFPGEPFPALLGMKVDQAGRLWLSGGRTGLMAAVDAKSGKEIRRFEVPTKDKSLINDVVVIESGAYYTDTLVPTLWRIPIHGDHIGELEPCST